MARPGHAARLRGHRPPRPRGLGRGQGLEDSEGEEKRKKKALGWRRVGGLGVSGGDAVALAVSIPGKLRPGAGSPWGVGAWWSPRQHPAPGGSPLARGVSGPSCCGDNPREGGAGGSHPTPQPLPLPPATAAMPSPPCHRRHAGTATVPAPRSRSPPPPLGILQAFNCRKHRLIKQR